MEWIKCSDRLPDYDIAVLVVGESIGMNPQMGGAYVQIAKRQNLDGKFTLRQIERMQDENEFSGMRYVTHWMPLPNPPHD